MREHIQAKRAALQAEQERDELAYARAEEDLKQRAAHLARMQRQLDMRSGAIQALDALLEVPDEEPCADSPPPSS